MTIWASIVIEQGDNPMVIQCPECEHGSKIARIYARPDEIRVVFHDDVCGCVLDQIDAVRLAGAVLRQQAIEMERKEAHA